MNRDQHVAWAKGRALAELDAGGPRAAANAIASIQSDLGKHPETAGHTALPLMGMLAAQGQMSTEAQVRKFVVGVR